MNLRGNKDMFIVSYFSYVLVHKWLWREFIIHHFREGMILKRTLHVSVNLKLENRSLFLYIYIYFCNYPLSLWKLLENSDFLPKRSSQYHHLHCESNTKQSRFPTPFMTTVTVSLSGIFIGKSMLSCRVISYVGIHPINAIQYMLCSNF